MHTMHWPASILYCSTAAGQSVRTSTRKEWMNERKVQHVKESRDREYQLGETSITQKEEGIKNCQTPGNKDYQLLQKASQSSKLIYTVNFTDACIHAHYTCTVHNCAFFMSLTFGKSSLSTKLDPSKISHYIHGIIIIGKNVNWEEKSSKHSRLD